MPFNTIFTITLYFYYSQRCECTKFHIQKVHRGLHQHTRPKGIRLPEVDTLPVPETTAADSNKG